ncbi:MAG: TetR/AcrR family transcriptional regulator [Pseudobacteriovorax sp.]|nr:TetR/AcrR family transcriptional regulator [Pseudobacteriovorax sp.]
MTSLETEEKKSSYHRGDLQQDLIKNVLSHLANGQDIPSFRFLAKELGVTHPAIYRHFKNRDQLIATVVSHSFKELREGFLASAQKAEDPAQKLMDMTEFFFRFFTKRPGLLDYMFGHQYETLKENCSIHLSADPVFDFVASIVSQLPNPPKRPDQYAVNLWAQGYGFVCLYLSKRLPRHAPNDEAALKMLLDGIMFSATGIDR